MFLRPTRQRFEKVESDAETRIVLDLDKLIPKPVAFQLHNKKHIVYPITVEQFSVLYEKVAKIDKLVGEKKIAGDELTKAYSDAFKYVCPTMTPDIIKNMTKEQIDAFFIFMFKILSGDAFKLDELKDFDEKKNGLVQSVSPV